jgi:serine/threonine protein kinase
VLISSLGEVRLADFGIAKAAGWLSVTNIKSLKGKLRYMAPEQAQGHAEPRSDLFALGAVLYEICCSRPVRSEAKSPPP